jgi:cytochrome c oxidase subunit 2
LQIAAPTIRRTSALAAVSIAALGLFAQTANAGVLFPDKGVSPGAESSTNLVIALTIIGTLVFVLVIGLLLGGLRREVPGLAGRSGGEAKVAGVAAFLVLAVIGGWAFLSSSSPDAASAKLGVAGYQPLPADDPQNPSAALSNPNPVDPPEGDYLQVFANAQQFLWRYTYVVEGQPVYAYHTLVVPTGVPVVMDVTSSDVVHSWWVPRVGGKVDAVPGFVNQTWFKIDKPGVYDGASVGVSGINFAAERTTVKAVEPAEFAKWLDGQKADLAAAYDDLAASRREQAAQAEQGGSQ